MKRLFLFWAVALAFAGGSLPAAAVPMHPTARQVEYVAAFTPLGSQSYPYSGLLRLTITGTGIISGTYVSTSIRPDPLGSRILAVSGGISGANVHFTIGNALRFTGKVNGRLFSGSATWRGRIYHFEAKQGWPAEGAMPTPAPPSS